MPEERRQNLAETDRRSYYKEESLETFLDSKGAIASTETNLTGVTSSIVLSLCSFFTLS